ncbi:hypothetical protein Tco_0908170 [Tanacetum coccineum]|uniref:Uncharacterized protein n=1 Tax=Tanacetum coccineum TaxID=301880 RepID=A0ABQ5CMI1_9ASTR
MLREQHKVDDSHYDIPLIYYTEGHSLHFGRPEFALITGLPFGTINFGLYTSGELKFHNRVFPHKLGLSVTNLDVIGVIEDEETFWKLCDQDSIHLCLILSLEDFVVEDELRLCLEDEEMMRLEQEKNILEDILGKLTHSKRNHVDIVPGKTNLTVKCKFPWSDDYTVGRKFWLTLACLDPSRKGWLSEEHIDLWVDYMWHGRPDNANWAMVSCYFVQILLQNNTPLFYTNGDKYATSWNDVDQLFEIDNERDFRVVRETYVTFQDFNVRCQERREQMIEMQPFLHVSTVLADSYNLLKELQDYELEKCRS